MTSSLKQIGHYAYLHYTTTTVLNYLINNVGTKKNFIIGLMLWRLKNVINGFILWRLKPYKWPYSMQSKHVRNDMNTIEIKNDINGLMLGRLKTSSMASYYAD